MAIGDALAAPVEFLRVGEILRRYPPAGPQAPEGDPARVTDDTQMALAVGEALLEAGSPPTPATLEPRLRRAFVDWAYSPDNNRAPGATCMRACGALNQGRPWLEATVPGSKGCGANMRVQPVGLLRGVSPALRAAVAQFQSALTHGHPTALAASDLTAAAIADLAAGGGPAGLPGRLRAYAESQRTVYHADWLGALWQQPAVGSPEEFIARGWDECLGALDRLDAALSRADSVSDPCLATGEGWIAEEALATGLLCFLLFPDDGPAALRRAAVTAGDSDSIACLAGSFAGAHLGMAAWPAEWVARIEYRDRLRRLGEAWDG
jgi:ADP-ribosylglycohydrolase